MMKKNIIVSSVMLSFLGNHMSCVPEKVLRSNVKPKRLLNLVNIEMDGRLSNH